MPQANERPLTEDEKRVVEANMRLVYAIASRSYRYSDLSVEDRVQAGVLGLMRAAQLFDPSRGFAFSTYATRWIKNTVQQAIMGHDVISVPLYVRHDHSDEREQARASRFHAARDRALGVGGGVVDDDVAGCGSPESAVDDADEAAWLAGRIALLTEKQQDVIRSIYWDGVGEQRIGRRHGVSRQRVWQWKDRALARLREMCEAEYAEGA
jgi:RNA polymerase sigma factor (sigma-70 family)